jgi:hypothetical protein
MRWRRRRWTCGEDEEDEEEDKEDRDMKKR